MNANLFLLDEISGDKCQKNTPMTMTDLCKILVTDAQNGEKMTKYTISSSVNRIESFQQMCEKVLRGINSHSDFNISYQNHSEMAISADGK